MSDHHRRGGAPWDRHTRRSGFDADGMSIRELRRRIRREDRHDDEIEDDEPEESQHE